MGAYFFDTSGLVKRFSRETGTAWTINLLKPSGRNTIYITRIKINISLKERLKD